MKIQRSRRKFEHASRQNIQVLNDIPELYVNNLASLTSVHGDGSLQQHIADMLYSKGPGEDGTTEEAFERASRQFGGPLEHALEEMVAEPA